MDGVSASKYAMLAVALALSMPPAAQGLALRLPNGGEVVYVETFKMTETSSAGTLSAEAERKIKLRVLETARGRTRFEVTFDDFSVKGSDSGLRDDLRSWLDAPKREQWVNERGYVERKDEPRGNRPYFGLVLPPPGASVPDRWTAKLLPPIGSDRPADFEFKLDPQSGVGGILTILVSAKDRVDAVNLSVVGRVVMGADGEIRFGDLSTLLEDGDAKSSTRIDYRFRKQ